MPQVVGILCEYDPFHTGHARQYALIRRQLPGARIVCLMSGCFTQRGSPALFSSAFRAETALRAGADLVLELPCAFAVRDAENFALHGVSILERLGFVTHLSFGCESEDMTLLTQLAGLLENPNAAFAQALRMALTQGKPYALAQAEAMEAGMRDQQRGGPPYPEEESIRCAIAGPNNILAICYLRALHRLDSAMVALPVKREGDYHASRLDGGGFPSASAVRKAFLAGDFASAESACGYPLSGATCHKPEALDAVLLHRLRGMTPTAFRELPDCSEGLENRLYKAVRLATDRNSLLAMLKTRRYTYARLNRLVTHALLGTTTALLSESPPCDYVRLLGFRKDSRDMLALVKKSTLPVLANAKSGNTANPFFALDMRAYDLWALGARLPAGWLFRQPIVIV